LLFTYHMKRNESDWGDMSHMHGVCHAEVKQYTPNPVVTPYQENC